MSRLTKHYCRLYEESVKSPKPEERQKFWNDVAADFAQRNVTPRDFSIRRLFETFVRDAHGAACGREIIESWVPDGGHSLASLEEAGMGAVTTAAFSKISGQIVYNEIMDAWNNPAFIAPRLARNVTTTFLDGEKIAGISAVGDDAEAIAETQPYPLTGITQAYVETPRPVKRGHILPLTKETLIADRTNVLLDRANTIANTMAMNKEKRVVDCAIGATDTWKRNGSTATATYANLATAPHNFDNLAENNGLADYTDIENAMLLFDAMTDAETGEPVVVDANQLLVSANLLYTARRIVNATQIEFSGAATTSSPNTWSANPLRNPNMGAAQMMSPIEILSSPYVSSRMYTEFSLYTTWFIGNFMKAFRYMEVWPLSSEQLPANSDWEFRYDIVRAWKVSEFGVPAVVEPRYVVKCTV